MPTTFLLEPIFGIIALSDLAIQANVRKHATNASDHFQAISTG
jgi:hypothetical protein